MTLEAEHVHPSQARISILKSRLFNYQPKSVIQDRESWLKWFEDLVSHHLEDSAYTIDQLAFDMSISKRQLARKVKEITGYTPNQYITFIRMAKAESLLENNIYDTVKAVAISVGLKDTVYFSKLYKKHFGYLPSFHLK